MEVVGVIASITTLVALAKELSTITCSILHSLQHAPKELIHVANQMSLISLELECIQRAQNLANFTTSILTTEESRILDQSLKAAGTTITALHQDCKKCMQPRNRLASRISWALFDSKIVNGALQQLHNTESNLSLVIQVINTYVWQPEDLTSLLTDIQEEELQGRRSAYQAVCTSFTGTQRHSWTNTAHQTKCSGDYCD
jgi:hypothetical protein